MCESHFLTGAQLPPAFAQMAPWSAGYGYGVGGEKPKKHPAPLLSATYERPRRQGPRGAPRTPRAPHGPRHRGTRGRPRPRGSGGTATGHRQRHRGPRHTRDRTTPYKEEQNSSSPCCQYWRGDPEPRILPSIRELGAQAGPAFASRPCG